MKPTIRTITQEWITNRIVTNRGVQDTLVPVERCPVQTVCTPRQMKRLRRGTEIGEQEDHGVPCYGRIASTIMATLAMWWRIIERFVRHPANYRLAKHILYTQGKTPSRSLLELLSLIQVT
jgi:hypothetical protein